MGKAEDRFLKTLNWWCCGIWVPSKDDECVHNIESQNEDLSSENFDQLAKKWTFVYLFV